MGGSDVHWFDAGLKTSTDERVSLPEAPSPPITYICPPIDTAAQPVRLVFMGGSDVHSLKLLILF